MVLLYQLSCRISISPGILSDQDLTGTFRQRHLSHYISSLGPVSLTWTGQRGLLVCDGLVESGLLLSSLLLGNLLSTELSGLGAGVRAVRRAGVVVPSTGCQE